VAALTSATTEEKEKTRKVATSASEYYRLIWMMSDSSLSSLWSRTKVPLSRLELDAKTDHYSTLAEYYNSGINGEGKICYMMCIIMTIKTHLISNVIYNHMTFIIMIL
jgi:hypothetical protein